MELSPSDKERIEHQFDRFCKKVLVGEMKDYKKQLLRKATKEVLFSEFVLRDFNLENLSCVEMKDVYTIKVMGFDIDIENTLIAEAVLSLNKKGRDIVLMSYFLEMTDKEIAKELKLVQSTVNYHKKNNLKKMRKFIEENDYDKKKTD